MLKIDGHRSKPINLKHYNSLLRKSIRFGITHENDGLKDRGQMQRILKPKPKITNAK